MQKVSDPTVTLLVGAAFHSFILFIFRLTKKAKPINPQLTANEEARGEAVSSGNILTDPSDEMM